MADPRVLAARTVAMCKAAGLSAEQARPVAFEVAYLLRDWARDDVAEGRRQAPVAAADWTCEGPPSPETVQAHGTAHPLSAITRERGEPEGGLWIVIDPMAPSPHFVSLKVATAEDVGMSSPPTLDLVGKVVLRNGYSFWQLLAETPWAARSHFVPVTARGLPVPGASVEVPRG